MRLTLDDAQKIIDQLNYFDCVLQWDMAYDGIKQKITEVEIVGQIEPLVSPHTKHFDEWLNKYFEGNGVHYCYKTKSGHKLFTLKELHKKFERAMKKSPIVSG